MFCERCGALLPKNRKIFCSFTCYTLWRREHPKENHHLRAKYKREIKEKIIKYYGGKCACCGEMNSKFLTIDHIRGGGRKERKNAGGATALRRKIIKDGFPSDLQCLCFNCHYGRHRNGGICPHKDKQNEL